MCEEIKIISHRDDEGDKKSSSQDRRTEFRTGGAAAWDGQGILGDLESTSSAGALGGI